MAFMVTAFREVISRVLAPVALVAATVLFFAGNAYAAQPLPWQPVSYTHLTLPTR